MKQFATLPRSPLKQYYLKMRSRLIVDRNGDWRKSVFIAGGSRSGTTWLAEVANYRNDYRYLFEPFNAIPMGQARWGSYLRPNNGDPTFLALAESVLSGRYRDPMADRYNRRLIASQRLVKEVSANLWLKWLKTQFADIPIIFIIRHPIPTIRSRGAKRLKAARGGQVEEQEQPRSGFLQYILDDTALNEDHLHPFRETIGGARYDWEQRLVAWCVQNYVPLHQFTPNQLHVVSYEGLCMDPLSEGKRLFAFLGKEIDEGKLKRSIRRPSQTSTHGGRLPDPWTLVSSWRETVTDDQYRRAAVILHAFGLDKVYSATDPMPNLDAVLGMMAANGSASTT